MFLHIGLVLTHRTASLYGRVPPTTVQSSTLMLSTTRSSLVTFTQDEGRQPF